jgi:hypothetical protein
MAVAGLLSPRLHADAVADLAKYSVFPQPDLGSLSSGKIVTARSPALDFSRDMSVQALYIIHQPVARTLAMHRQWNPNQHPELKLYLHHDFPTHPTAADFSQPLPGNSAVRRLEDATGRLPSLGDLQLSNAEAAQYKGAGGFQPFWSQVLLHRASDFVSRGLGGEPPYENDGSVRVSDEVGRLLREQPKLRAAFSPLLGRSVLGGGTGSLAMSPYWELFDVEGQAAFSLGASSGVQAGDGAQMLDVQYYSSGGYYAFFTLYDMWPVTAGGSQATLVWRIDSIASLSLSDLRPFARMGSGAAMMRDVQRIITCFERDMGR